MSFFSRLFGRNQRQLTDGRKLSEDWKVGDLAVCLIDRWWPGTASDPKKGDLLRVSCVSEGIVTGRDYLVIGLRFESKPQHIFWNNINFRKVRPDLEPAEATFAALIKKRRRVDA